MPPATGRRAPPLCLPRPSYASTPPVQVAATAAVADHLLFPRVFSGQEMLWAALLSYSSFQKSRQGLSEMNAPHLKLKNF